MFVNRHSFRQFIYSNNLTPAKTLRLFKLLAHFLKRENQSTQKVLAQIEHLMSKPERIQIQVV